MKRHDAEAMWVGMGDNQSQAQLDGFKTRVLRAGAAGVRPAMQRMHVARRGAISGVVLA